MSGAVQPPDRGAVVRPDRGAVLPPDRGAVQPSDRGAVQPSDRGAVLRAGRDTDAAGFIALIGACWAEYPGCILDVDAELPELRALATHFAGLGGGLFVAEAGGEVVGMAATRPLGDGAWELCKVYLARAHRGGGLAHALLDAAEGLARGGGATRLVLWSDTRFLAAHRFYEKRGYVRRGPIRVLDDLSKSLEFRYERPLGALAVLALDAAGADSAARHLAALEGGAAGPALAAALARGRALLFAAWADGAFAGAARLDLPEAASHRAELGWLAVAPAWRRRGAGRALLRAGVAAAAGAGRGLLTAACPAGGAAEALYRAEGWTVLGVIPGHGTGADGRPRDTAFLWTRVG